MNDLLVFFGILVAIAVVFGILGAIFPSVGKAIQEADEINRIGVLNKQIICPHCDTAGKVYTKRVTNKKGVSGGKATGAILTGGVSLLATGLSRKEKNTQAHCKNCNSTWSF